MKNKEKDRIIHHELDNPLLPVQLKEELEKIKTQIEKHNTYMEVSDEDLSIIFENIPEGYDDYDN